jgi:hypothetical protein
MCQYINDAGRDPLVQAIARRAVDVYKGGPGWVRSNNLASPFRTADSCWWWCKLNLKFRHHGDQFEAWSADLGDPRTKLQLLISPDVLVRMRRMEGDCAIYTMMICAMLRSLGLQYQILTLAVDPRTPEIFTHVCARVVTSQGSETLDASHGDYPGWQVPQEHTMRMWTFDESGRRIPTGRFIGLHDYRRTMFRTSRGMRGYRRGMGAEPSLDPSGDQSVDYFNPTEETGNFGSNPFGTTASDWGGFEQSGGGYVAPSQNSSQWAQFASNLAKMGYNLAAINSIQPGTVVQPNGAILRQNPGYAVPAGGTISTNIGSASSLLVIGGIGLVGILLLGSMFKGGR